MRLQTTYEVLSAVIREGTYINIALAGIADESERAFVTKVAYGVLEKYYELSYIVDGLSEKPPKLAVKVLLMEGVYCLKYTDIPHYAVVDEMVELAKALNQTSTVGYTNALLKKVANGEYRLPKKGELGAKEVEYNLPYWLIRLIKEEYPKAYKRILTAPVVEEEHVRLARGADESILKDTEAKKTLTGYFVKNSPLIKKLNEEGKLTYQSLTSTMAALALGDVENKEVLDLCSAPGGKAVYLAERGARVTACDLYPHRVDLIGAYARRMKVKLTLLLNDGTKRRDAWNGKFDAVLVDAPCSGLGVIAKRRDIILNRKPSDMDTLAELQKVLLNNCADYVKVGGAIVYSTCTILKKENSEVVADFLARHDNFEPEVIPLEGNGKCELQFLPDGKGLDGFYIARLKRIK